MDVLERGWKGRRLQRNVEERWIERKQFHIFYLKIYNQIFRKKKHKWIGSDKKKKMNLSKFLDEDVSLSYSPVITCV